MTVKSSVNIIQYIQTQVIRLGLLQIFVELRSVGFLQASTKSEIRQFYMTLGQTQMTNTNAKCLGTRKTSEQYTPYATTYTASVTN